MRLSSSERSMFFSKSASADATLRSSLGAMTARTALMRIAALKVSSSTPKIGTLAAPRLSISRSTWGLGFKPPLRTIPTICG